MAINRILVVDDDRMLRQLLVHKLSRIGCPVDQAENGQAALDQIRTAPPGLIILDAMMPVMDGHETLRQLKSNPETAHIPVFMLTAKRGDADMEDALKLGAADYVAKPFNPDDLILRIAQFVLARHDQDSPGRKIG